MVWINILGFVLINAIVYWFWLAPTDKPGPDRHR